MFFGFCRWTVFLVMVIVSFGLGMGLALYRWVDPFSFPCHMTLLSDLFYLQSTLTYYGCNCDNESAAFSLELATELNEGRPSKLTLYLRMKWVNFIGLAILTTWLFLCRYLEKVNSNMVILDIELPSGYSFESWKYSDRVHGCFCYYYYCNNLSMIFLPWLFFLNFLF